MRITGGTHRSRPLRAPRGSATRPTSDRVREALFGILASAGAIEGANVLNLYAGTGRPRARSAVARRRARHFRRVFAVRSRSAQGKHCCVRLGGERAHRRSRCRAKHPSHCVSRALRRRFGRPSMGPGRIGRSSAGCRRPSSRGSLLARRLGGDRALVPHAPPAASPLLCAQARAYGDTTLTFCKTAILDAPSPDARADTPSD